MHPILDSQVQRYAVTKTPEERILLLKIPPQALAMPDYPFGLLFKTCDMLPNVPHSRMMPTLPLRPSHPWPGVAKGLGPRVKRCALPNSLKSAPLAGGRFRRPAKTRANTPSGAHLSRRRRVRKLVGEARGGAKERVTCTRGPRAWKETAARGRSVSGADAMRQPSRRATAHPRRRCAEGVCGTVPHASRAP